MQYYDEYFHKNMDYFKHTGWKLAANRWLRFLNKIDPVCYSNSKSRVTKGRKSETDGFIAEIIAVYFIGKRLGLKVLGVGSSGELLDFSFIDRVGKTWGAEVKSPGWEGRVVDEAKTNHHDEKVAYERVKKDKYANGEAKSFDSENEIREIIRNSIEKSLKKFNANNNNLLIIVPDLDLDIFTLLKLNAMKGIDSEAVKLPAASYGASKQNRK
ncbi:hypothetical protein COY32_05225 [candidate division WWE3 bacterium CG_4_10_14_0_2_um_filter_41_14]|uniref:Uncharacterized protein n=1 Tax=candidate division WWE3 bacterium CG_4_10_14_0_2_um_filter_41_14 TaxID=1975072 RepID=A0A2M7TH57_UNCKA|nr:MAG: hypothetical protein COY32_05225 [candidate division WWE3 bacterium CG_4_10_14_0_2_um_filter_41_14]